MARLHRFMLLIGVAIAFSNLNIALGAHHHHHAAAYRIKEFNRTSFPPGFIFGAATSSYQIEGGWNADGKGPSIWDHFVHKYPERINDSTNGDVACNSYNLYKSDVKLLRKMNADAYRFSISWPRILPRGKLSRGVNEKGIAYYNKLIDSLIANGIQPFVTLFHWDCPQALEEEYGGFLSPKIVKDFRDYANLCFERFGDRVKFWSTFNEPLTYTVQGYDAGTFPPFRCSSWKRNCTGGDSSTEPYLVSHYQLLSHAAAAKSYRTKYKPTQKGQIGIVLVTSWFEPLTNSNEDKTAAQQQLDFNFGWFMQPLVTGDYPTVMRTFVGKRLPEFTKEQSELLKGSIDFLGLNYYTGSYTTLNRTILPVSRLSYSTDSQVTLSNDRKGVLVGKEAASSWLHIYPKGFYNLLQAVKTKYNNPIIYITENGVDEVNNASLPLRQALSDAYRVRFYHDHLQSLHKAIQDFGVRVRGYFAWSLLDNYEWNAGYSVRFGLHYVDYNNKAQRYPKISAKWFRRFYQKKKAAAKRLSAPTLELN